ncbi:YiiX family permuted papain-like enzyme [Flavobacterium amniphilum]|uniref:YiiX family permuted papain-like enzyme n=1 Tax=Flavobacterium amniphilum TaxID=1834035 RepID=UPI00202A1592|nr:YiiX family permuted papain-like enzyme [Flavobacterium amniphilum]MCL9806599.1 YiiX family permuted papain-like enzyme [Flavobacterium amniphilum]
MTKKILYGFIVAGLITFAGLYSCAKSGSNPDTKKQSVETLKDGDIIFQTSQSAQCEAVRIATRSKFSHCGIIFTRDNKKFVLEAVQPVKITPFEDWIQHGKDNCYLVKRLKDTLQINNQKMVNMKHVGTQFIGKNYDLYFEWSDDRIYCSELVWKIYKEGAGIELCKQQTLQSFDLKNEKVQEILKERYGNNIPLNEKVVAPSQLADSKLLETIIDTYTF